MTPTQRDPDTLLPPLPAELEDAWIDALAGASPSPDLQRWLDQHPDAARDLDQLTQLTHALAAERSERHPGARFFDALHDDILAQLDAPQPVELRGFQPTPAPAPAAGWLGLMDRLRDLLGRRPTLAYAGAMSLALLALLAFALASPTTTTPPPTTPPLASAPSAQPHPPALPAALAHLDPEELAALQEQASRIQIDLGGAEEDDDASDEEALASLVGWNNLGFLAAHDADDAE